MRIHEIIIVPCILIILGSIIYFGICASINRDIKMIEYYCFIEWIKNKANIDTWINKLIDKGYSPEYINENAEKYRDEFFETMGISLEDVNMTYKQYVKYKKKQNKDLKIVTKNLRKDI